MPNTSSSTLVAMIATTILSVTFLTSLLGGSSSSGGGLVMFAAAATFPNYTSHDCPSGWAYSSVDDTCSALWPRLYYNDGRNVSYNATRAALLSVPMNFLRAQQMCAEHGATLPIIRSTGAQLDFYKDLLGRTSGRSVWLGVQISSTGNNLNASDPLASWEVVEAADRRPSGFVFDWDTIQKMPRSYDRCVALHMKGIFPTTHGGNEKMIGTDCNAAHHVVCTRPRVVPGIGAVNGGDPRRIEFIFNTSDLRLVFHGSKIPLGTLVTLQTGTLTAATSTAEYRRPTQCSAIKDISGAAAPFTVNVTARDSAGTNNTFNKIYCKNSTTCDVGEITIPASWPLIRGAVYSLCFFIAEPFSAPVVLKEYRHALLGPAMEIAVVERYTTYLQDVCARRRQSISTFFEGYNELSTPTTRDDASRYFDAPVEASYDRIQSFAFNTIPKGYELFV